METNGKAISNQPVVKSTEIIADGKPLRVPVDEIIPDPNQPRKTFYKMSIEELSESIKWSDVMQPIKLRIVKDKKMIIFGERRWRASKLAGLKDVPAYLIEATDEEALRMQIVENIQREDLPIMEQAIGVRNLLDKCKMKVEDIALMTGRSVYIIRQHIKLTELAPQWQKMLMKDALPISTALQISSLPENTQKKLYEDNVSKEDEKSERPVIHINQYTINKYKGLLSQASFDINDATLDVKMGACTKCPFNSACNSLFPDEQKEPKCNNIGCFTNKSEIHRQRQLKIAKEDPTVLLVYDSNSLPDELKKIKSDGTQIFKLGYSDDCKEIREPRKPIWEDFMQQGRLRNQPEKEIKSQFKKAEDDYSFSKAVFDKNIANGKYKKAFVAHADSGSQSGKYIYVELNQQKAPAKKVQAAIAEGNASVHDIDDEISRLADRLKRAEEIAEEKVHSKIVEILKDPKFLLQTKSNNRLDQLLLYFLLTEQIPFGHRPEIQKFIKSPNLFGTNDPDKFIKCLETVTKEQVSFLIRYIIVDKYSANLPATKAGLLIRKLAESISSIPISDFEKEQKEKLAQQKERATEKITELKKRKQELTKKVSTPTNTKTINKSKSVAA